MIHRKNFQSYITRKEVLIASVSLLLLIVLPVVVILTSKQQNLKTNAAGAATIEAESGTTAGSVTVVSDAAASGGNYVRFGTAPSGPDFPRIGAMLIGSPQNYDQVSYQQQIAKFDMAVVGMYPGWNKSGKSITQAVSEIKARNPNILLANYTIMTEVSNDPANTATVPWQNKLNSEKGPNGIGNWWAYDSAGNHADWSGGQFGTWDTNLTLLTTPDANGDRWPQWKAKNDYQTLYQGRGFDFWFSDNNFWKPRIDNDWNRDGTNDSQNSISVRNWWRDGQRAYYDAAKTVAPSMMMMVNTDNDLDGSVYPSGADQFTQFKNVLGGAYLEHTMGKSWSVETWGGWSMLMSWYRKVKVNLIAPKTILFDAFMPSTTDYQSFRYAFASCLMDDGYFSASTDYSQVTWYDEYDLAGTASTKWLGKALDGPQTSPWQNGVYRRNFEHGTVLVNPKGNGAKTVTLEAGYSRFQGTQAPTINNGQPVTTLTLNDRDGIFLKR